MKLKFTLLTLFIALQFNAQSNYEKGFIIKVDGTKLEGFILNEDWINTPKQISFKEKENSKTENIATNFLSKIDIDNNIVFERYIVKINTYSMDLKELDKSRKSNFKEETLLLKLLVKAERSLYQYTENNINYFFYKKENEILPFEYKLYKTSNNNIAKNLNYRKTLSDEFKCSSRQLSYNFDYNKKNFIKFFEEYNECINSNLVLVDKRKSSGKFNLRGKISVGNSTLNTPVNRNLGDKIIFKFGAEFEYVFPFNNNKWSMLFEPTYQSYKEDGFEYSSIENFLGARHYFFVNKNNKLFINAGALIDYTLGSEIKINNVPQKVNQSTITFATGVGYDFNDKYSIEFRYNSERNITLFSGLDSTYSNISLKFGYNFL